MIPGVVGLDRSSTVRVYSMVHKPVSVQYKSSYEEVVQRTLVISITFIAIQVLNLSSVSGNYIYVEVKA